MPESLRIAQVAPLANPVAPEIGSSIEQLVWLLSEELVRRGHEVTLFATGDSETSARLHAVYPHSYKKNYKMWDTWQYHELMHLAAAFERARDFDVIHSHVYHFAPAFARFTETPAVHTDHIPQSRDIRDCYARYPDSAIVAISRYHRSKFASLVRMPIIYNGIATDSFPFNEKPGEYLVFLGHLIERKGPLKAIQLAKKADMPLILAGHADPAYFDAEIKPLVDGKFIQYIGPVGVEKRNELLSNAAALVFTSRFAEPFGLVMIEAMACGTPVAALERCAVPEIVDRGATGYYAKDVGSLAALIPKTVALDRAHCREQAQKRFDYRRMTGEYEALYRRVTGRAAPGDGWWLE